MGHFIFRLGILAALIAVAGAQSQSGQRETFRVRVTLVPVDVQVVDSRGRPVRGLKLSDFELTENGRPQEIVYFAEGRGSDPTATPEMARDLGLDPEALRPPAARNFLIYLGRGRHRENFNSVRHLAGFVAEKLDPQDRVAVMAYNRSTVFTTDHAGAAELIRAYEKINLEVESKLDTLFRGLAGIYRSTDLPPELQQTIDEVFSRRLPAVPLAASPLLDSSLARSGASTADMMSRIESLDFVSEAVGAGGGAEGAMAPSPFDRMQLELTNDLPLDEFFKVTGRLRFDVGNISTAIDYLQSVPGEKHLIALTDGGWNLGRQPGDGRTEAPEVTLARLASHARVRLHVIDTGGMPSPMGSGMISVSAQFRGPGSAISRRTSRGSGLLYRSYAVSSTRNLAQLTGGRSYARQYADRALNSILAATEAYYLLGYTPAGPDDAGFRRIRVSVRKKGLRVLHRTGYYAETDEQRADRERARMQQLTLAAAESTLDLKGVTIEAERSDRQTNSDGVTLAAVVDVEPETFIPAGERYAGTIAVLYATFSEEGEMLSTVWDTIEMNLRPEVHSALLERGLGLRRFVQIDPDTKPEAVKLVVLDYRRGRVGSFTVPIGDRPK